VPWLLFFALASGGCDACEDEEMATIAEPPQPRREAVRLPEVRWPPTLRAVAAPAGTWDDHQLAVDPTTGKTWLASIDSDEEGAFLLSKWADGAWETERISLSRPMGGSFLRFAMDGEGEPHLLYYRVVGEVDTEGYEARIVHAFRGAEGWETEVIHSEPRELDHASSVGWLAVDAAGAVVFLHRRGRAVPTLVRRVDGQLESRPVVEEELEVGMVLAFEIGEERVRFAWSDPTRSKVFVSADDGPTRELHAFEDFSIRRHLSAAFTPNGELHVVAEHHDNISFFHLVFDRHGIRRSSVAPFANGLAVQPQVSFDEVGALVTHARVDADGWTGELWITRIQRQLRPMGVAIAPLEMEEDNLVIDFGPPVVDPQGRLFIGTKGWIHGPGTVWTSAP
jgi:hypothetical protein